MAAKAVDAAAGRTARAPLDLFGDNANLNRFVLCGAGFWLSAIPPAPDWSFSGGCRGVLFSAAGHLPAAGPWLAAGRNRGSDVFGRLENDDGA